MVWIGDGGDCVYYRNCITNKGNHFLEEREKIKKAREAGNTILAQRVSYRFNTDSNGERRYIAQYKYELNGRERTKQEISHGMKPPSSITLYVVGENKVMSEYDKKNPLEVIIYIIPLACAVLVMKMLGFQG